MECEDHEMGYEQDHEVQMEHATTHQTYPYSQNFHHATYIHLDEQATFTTYATYAIHHYYHCTMSNQYAQQAT